MVLITIREADGGKISSWTYDKFLCQTVGRMINFCAKHLELKGLM